MDLTVGSAVWTTHARGEHGGGGAMRVYGVVVVAAARAC
jgi:hypothetical protein